MPVLSARVPTPRRACVGFASLMLGATLAGPASALDVWVDFTTDFHDGSGSTMVTIAARTGSPTGSTS